MQVGRPIRIPRSSTDDRAPGAAPRADNAPEPGAPRGSSENYRSNRGGFARAFRIYLLYLIALAALYGFFLTLDIRSTVAGTSISESGILGFTLVALALAVVGAWVTLGQAPRGARFDPRQIVVTERWGRVVIFPPAEDLKIRLVRRHPRSFLSPTPTATVLVVTQAGARRTYLIDEKMLPGDPTSWLV